MKRQRGSVMLFVVVMISMITISLLASVQLATSSAELQTRREREVKAKLAYEGAVQIALTDYKKNSLSLPATVTYDVGDVSVKLVATDNSATLARTVKFDGSMTVQGRKVAFSRTVGNRKEPHPFYYALFVNGNLDPSKNIVLGSSGSNGDLCVNGSIVARTNTFTINGDVEEIGTTLPATASITGNTFKSSSSVSFPTFNKTSYSGASPVSILVSSIAGRAFPALEPYQLLYRTGDIDISGAFSGKGTLFVDGRVTVKGNLSYSGAGSRLVVIATGDIIVDPVVTSYVGFYYTPTTFKMSSANAVLTSGSIAAQSLNLSGPIVATHDASFWNDPLEAQKHYVPGFWP